jgi:hypothetical protein
MKDERTGLDVASVGDAEGVAALAGLDAPTADASLEARATCEVRTAGDIVSDLLDFAEAREWSDRIHDYGDYFYDGCDACQARESDGEHGPRCTRRALVLEARAFVEAERSAVVRAVDASRPGLTERDAADIELARAVRDTLRETTHDGAIERLEELLDVEKEAAARPGLTEEQLDVLAAAMPDVVDFARATPDRRRETVLDLLAEHGPSPEHHPPPIHALTPHTHQPATCAS